MLGRKWERKQKISSEIFNYKETSWWETTKKQVGRFCNICLEENEGDHRKYLQKFSIIKGSDQVDGIQPRNVQVGFAIVKG